MIDRRVLLHDGESSVKLRHVSGGAWKQVIGNEFFGKLIYRMRNGQWESALRSDTPDDLWCPLHQAGQAIEALPAAGRT